MLSLVFAISTASCVAPVPVEKARLTSRFGVRPGLVSGTHFHQGIDLAAPIGTPVYSVVREIVTRASVGDLGGMSVVLQKQGDQNRGSLLILYDHLDSMEVVRGQRVFPGDRIGTVGQSGLANGAHLHFATFIRDRATGERRPVPPSSQLTLCPYPVTRGRWLGGHSVSDAKALNPSGGIPFQWPRKAAAAKGDRR